MSAIININAENFGPNTDPCGTHCFTTLSSNRELFYQTYCERPLRYGRINILMVSKILKVSYICHALFFRLMAYRGLTNIAKSNQPTKMCFLIACESKNPNTCGTRNVNNTVTFTHLSVRAKVRNLLDQYFMPVTLTTDLLPVFNTTYETSVNQDVDRIMELTNVIPQSNVLLFGIFSNGVERLSISWMLSVLVAFNLLKYFL